MRAQEAHLLELSGLLSGILKSLRVGMGGTRASFGSWEWDQFFLCDSANRSCKRSLSLDSWHKIIAGFMGVKILESCERLWSCTLVSASELRRGLEAERVMPRTLSGGLLGSWLASDSPAEPRVTELPAFLRDVLQEPGASVVGGLLRSCYRVEVIIYIVQYRWHRMCLRNFSTYFTFFTWLAAVLVDMEVGSRLVALRLLFKLFMISRFLAFSETVWGHINESLAEVIKPIW